MKIVKLFVLGLFALSIFSVAFAQDYIYFYGNGCSHCAKVEKFFEENDIVERFNVEEKEVYFNRDNLQDLKSYAEKLGISVNQVGVPFLVIDSEEECSYINGDQDIIKFFENKLDESCSNPACDHEDCGPTCTHLNCEENTLLTGSDSLGNVENKLGFFGVMLPAALADSINPCEFAVMLLLLSGILIRTKNRKKAILSGLLFSLSVFISYFGMGLGLFTALASAQNTYVLKIVVGILGLVVGLANLKDFFWYGRGFVMEVPFSRRPTMQKVIDKATSPLGAFLVGFLVSLFLLPCTSGPYLTILGYLASESDQLHFWGYVYLVIYNIIFILPMLIITGLVGLGIRSPEQLAKIKKNNTKLIHLIVGLLMLGLGAYVLITM